MPNGNGRSSSEEKMAAPAKAQPESKASVNAAAATPPSVFPGPKSLTLLTPPDVENKTAAAGFQHLVDDMEIDAWQHQLP